MTLHYKSCGLNNIWLKNGFEIRQTPYGKATSYQDVDGLFFAIAVELCLGKHVVTPEVFRFLRKQLNFTQAALGNKLGYTDQTIAKWEKGTLKIPIVAAQYLRLLCMKEFVPGLSLKEAVQENTVAHDGRITFGHENGEWWVQRSDKNAQGANVTHQEYIATTLVKGKLSKIHSLHNKPRWITPSRCSSAKPKEPTNFVEFKRKAIAPVKRLTNLKKGIVKYGNEKNYH